MSRYRSHRIARWIASASLLSVAAAFALPAAAQDGEETVVSDVVITGSRTIRDGSTAPTPVSVLSIEQLQSVAPKNIVEGLQSLPALRGTSSTNSTNASAQRNFAGSYLNLRNLGSNRTLVLLDGRRVAPSSVDGYVNFNNIPQSLIKRIDIVTGGASAAYGSDAVAGVVNVILDTEFTGVKGLVQGGIADTGDVGNYKAELSYGGAFLDDRLRVLVSAGTHRSNKLASMMERRWAQQRQLQFRVPNVIAWQQGKTPNISAPVASGGLVAQYNATGVRTVTYPGGLIVTTSQPSTLVNTAFGLSAMTNYSITGAAGNPGQGYKILPNGEGSPYSFGDWATATAQGGGDGVATPLGAAALLEGYQGFARVAYDITDDLEIFSDFTYSYAHNNYALSINDVLTGANSLVIYEDNVFLQQTATDAYSRLTSIAPSATGYAAYISACNTLVNQVVDPNPVLDSNYPLGRRCFRFARNGEDVPPTEGDGRTTYQNFTLGFRANIFNDWRLSGYYNIGRTDGVVQTPGSQYLQRRYAVADAIANPAVGGVPGVAVGAPVCGILVHGSDAAKAKYAGCQPANYFGLGNVSQASIDWFMWAPKFITDVKQQVYALDLAGEPFVLPAGPLSFAVGVEHRELDGSLLGGEPLSTEIRAADTIRGYPPGQVGQQGVFEFTNQSSFGAVSKVNEAYTELNVPLVRDWFLVQDLSLNGAYRYTDYSLSGPVKTWKVGLSYQPIESLRFRGTRSRDIRAPAINELASGNVTAGFPFNDIGQTPALNPTPNARTTATGNPGLQPEIADTSTYGVVFTPTWIPGFTATIDYYDIQINDSIVLQNGNDPIVDCVTRQIASACSQIVREGGAATPVGGSSGPLPPIQTVTIFYINQSTFVQKGWDVELSYRRSFDPIPGEFSLRTIWSYMSENYVQTRPGQEPTYQLGEVAVSSFANSNPRFRAITTLGWENGGFGVQLAGRYTGSAHSATYASIPTRYVEGVNIDNNRVGSYTLIDLSGRYRFGENVEYEAFLSINNLFNTPPPKYSSWSTSYLTNMVLYDTVGRNFVTGLKFRF